jgi:hypothetical protein
MSWFNHFYNRGINYREGKQNKCNIYIEIGDSNAGGPVTEPGGFDAKYQSSDRVKIFYKPDLTSTVNGSWQLYSTRATPTINRRPGFVPGSFSVGADQSFVWNLGQSGLKSDLRYIKFAIGGSTLISVASDPNDWNPDSTEAFELFYRFNTFFYRQAMNILGDTDRVKDVEIKGVVVRLGTNDCTTANWNQATFLAAVPRFVLMLRNILGNQSIPIYWVQVNTNLSSAAGGAWNATNVGQARTIISNCASGGATPITNFFVKNYDADPLESDGVHYTADSFITQGEDYATTFIALGD